MNYDNELNTAIEPNAIFYSHGYDILCDHYDFINCGTIKNR